MLFGGIDWTAEQVQTARDRAANAVDRSCRAYALLHRGDPCSQAAAESLRAILNQDTISYQTAKAMRRAAREAHRCLAKDDTLRKREQPILELAAHNLFQELTEEQAELLPSRESILNVLRPFAELAGLNVSRAAKLFSQRAALTDDDILYAAVAEALWAVAKLGVLPVYGLQRLEAMGIRDISDQAIEYLLAALIQVPFTEQPDDLNQLATAIRLNEEALPFFGRLTATPVMEPVVQRFVYWLARHDPKACLYDSNDVNIGYCGPHYYAAMCESWGSAAEDYASGEFSRDMQHMLEAAGLGARGRKNVVG